MTAKGLLVLIFTPGYSTYSGSLRKNSIESPGLGEYALKGILSFPGNTKCTIPIFFT
jgi:hypothetical protein